MHVLSYVMSSMRPLIAISIIKSGVYQVGPITMDYIEFYLIVSFFRLIICPSFYWQCNLVDKVDVVIKIHVGNV